MTLMDETPKDIQEGVPPISDPGAVITPTAPTTNSTFPTPIPSAAVPQSAVAQTSTLPPSPQLPPQPVPIAPENMVEQPLPQIEPPSPDEAASVEVESDPEEVIAKLLLGRLLNFKNTRNLRDGIPYLRS